MSIEINGTTGIVIPSGATGSMVGTVSESGGVPTGALIESGSNVNGFYTRFADGTQICRNTLTGSASAYETVTWPMPFTDTNYQVSGVCSSSTSTTGVMLKVHTKTTTTIQSALVTTGNIFSGISYDITAIGRWY
jgi:hypothetical protein